ncbi:hypothetical protein GCM10010172_38880 [Paractinoplanes ferrugineus]|uniref:Uncharacterized protein n=1 Tax=Paractinoplanes ferrugineus TaxID=113564 RepID=A0A919MFE7_9ACTN|nr:hypothetical protein [Actinoplanes ferrugineus]GIE12664.1 hypothetical protein Afe05nite_45040 [Actinoplanes ferrugineus]
MRRPAAPTLDGPRAERWRAAAAPWWALRIALLLGWVSACAVAVITDRTSCTPLDPGVCGPDLPFAVSIVVLVATPVLVWWLPLAGCASGILFAVLDLIYDDLRAAHLAFAAHALLCAGIAAWLVVAHRRQAAIVAEVAGTVRLDPALTERLRPGMPGWGARTLCAVLLLIAGIGGLTWYAHRTGQVTRHEAAAVRMDAVVRTADQAEDEIVVEVPRPVRVAVLDSYEPGQVVPVLVDGSWVHLVAEPADVTGWLSAGLGAFALAALLLVREQRMRVARRRLLSGPLPAVELTAEPDDQGRAVLRDGLAVVPVMSAPLRLARPHLTGEEVEWADGWPAEPAEDFGRDWRGPGHRGEPPVVTVAGDLRAGGWVLLLTDSVVLLPEAPVRIPRRRPEPADALPGEPVPVPAGGDGPDLPVVLRPRARDRLLGALSLLGFAAGPAVVLVGLPDDWWQTVVALWFGGFLTYSGWSRLTSRVALTRDGLVVHAGLRIHRVPWQRLHGVRADDEGLWLAWEPDVAVQVSRLPDRAGAMMMRLRELALAAGGPGGPANSRLGGGPAVLAGYVLVALAAVWWGRR